MKKNRWCVVIMMLLLSAAGCTPSYLYLPHPTVYMKKGLPDHDYTTTLTVLPFEGPSYYPEIGMYTAKLFYQKLLERHGSIITSLSQETDWYEKGMSWNGKTAMALDAGRRNESDYILIGSVDNYLVGHITNSRVIVTARLMEVSTGETLYFASGYGSGKPGKTFLLFDIKSGEYTPSTTSVIAAVVDNLVKDCFGIFTGYLEPLNPLISLVP